MQITISVTNPSLDFLMLLGAAIAPNNNGATKIEDSIFDDLEPVPARITTRDQLSAMELGQVVDWRGLKFNFRGTVVEIDEEAVDEDWVLRLQRSDTGKIVRLTYDDLQMGYLYLL